MLSEVLDVDFPLICKIQAKYMSSSQFVNMQDMMFKFLPRPENPRNLEWQVVENPEQSEEIAETL